MPKRRTQHLKDRKRQISQGNFPKWFAEQVNWLHIVDTFSLAYSADIMVREGWLCAHLRRADCRRVGQRPVFSAHGSGSENQPVLNLEKTPGAYPCGGAAAG